MAEESPQFRHDCPACTFLGRFEERDLYFCTQNSSWNHTVIARYGDSGSAYSSGMPFAVDGPAGIPALFEAKKRAQAKGLVK